MSANLYDAEFYAARRPLLPEYQAMGEIVEDVFLPIRALDCGCGPGEVLGVLKRHGCVVLGLDASPSAREAAGDVPVLVADLTDCPLNFGETDLVLCLETAEHVPESKAGALVEFVARATWRWLVWSAATPGQGGTGHVNERHLSYWIGLLEAQGLSHRHEMSRALRRLFAAAAPRQPWYGKTTMVFERAR